MPFVSQDLRYGARILGKTPGITAIALMALALGTGASTVIFSVVDAVLLKPLPFRDPGQLLVVWEKSEAHGLHRMFVARSNFWEWQQQSSTLAGIAAIQEARISLTAGPNGRVEPEELKAERVSAGLFPLLGVQAIVGRTFLPQEDQPGNLNFALLSYNLWQTRFGADSAIAGKTLRLRDQSYTVVGVLSPGFTVLTPDVDLYLPLGLDPHDARSFNSRTLVTVARMKPGVTLAQADREMDLIGARLEQASPALNAGWRPSLFPIREELEGKTRQPLLILSGAVGLLLLMACANVASLLLARGASRRKEIAIRFAMGAARSRVMAQLLSESLLLSLAGGALGLALARVGISLVRRFGPESVPQLRFAAMDGRLFLFALAIAAATGIVFGILPAILNSGVDLNVALTETSRGGTAGRKGRAIRGALVVAEVALAVVVLIGAGLLVRSFARLRAVNPGFQPAGILTMRLPLAGGRNAAMERRAPFIHQVLENLSALPGVQGAAAVTSLPLAGLDVGTTFAVAGRPAPPADRRPLEPVRYISGGYFATMGIPLLSGRTFGDGDTAQSTPVALVNQTLARRFFADENPIGQHLILDSVPLHQVEIIGVVGDVKQEKIVNEERSTIYIAYTQLAPPYIVAVLRTSGDPRRLALAAARSVHAIDANQVVTEVRPLEDLVQRAVAEPRFEMAILTCLAAVALLLSAVGIYGVISYDVNDRVHELGIRMALGAQRGDVLRLVITQGAVLAAIGIAIGLAAALRLTQLMASMLYGVAANDVYTFAGISLSLWAVALVASYIPSRRAAALAPAIALRND